MARLVFVFGAGIVGYLLVVLILVGLHHGKPTVPMASQTRPQSTTSRVLYVDSDRDSIPPDWPGDRGRPFINYQVKGQ